LHLVKTLFHNQLSYDYGASREQLLGATIGDHFRRIVAANPDDLALISCQQNEKFSYAQLNDRVERFARGMIEFGIARGDRIGIWSTNNSEWIVAKLAAAYIGAIFVNINPGYKSAELEFVLNQSGTKFLVVVPENRGTNYLEILQGLAPELFSSKERKLQKITNLEHIAVIGAKEQIGDMVFSVEQVCLQGDTVSPAVLEERIAQLDIDDPINIQYTSGTTGAPKGVTLSHHNLLNNAWLSAKAMGLTRQSRFCVPMPFYHCGGMVSSALSTLSVGGAIVIPSPYFMEEPVLQAVQSERCTHLSGVPTMFIAELEHADFSKYDVSTLRGGFMAGAPCPVQLMRRVADDMNMREVVILYGLTEASPLVTCTTVEDSLEIRATTVGRAIPGIEIKIVDPHSGSIVPRGDQGELCTRGHAVMIGYWNNAQATSDAIDKGGWLHSGDLAKMGADGFINITGRKKDMIIRGGENIYPREIEEVLHEHGAIAQAQVFGIPDEKFGEEVAVWLKLKQGQSVDQEQIVTWLKERIAHFKVPHYVRIVDDFPMTVTGKVQKFVMRERMIAELGLQQAAEIRTA
jgi:fatty-acyl-CoA synthase